MRWEDERYVRVYTRDTADWVGLSWDAQSLLMHLFRKVDRAGILRLGRRGVDGLAPVLGHAGDGERIKAALQELLDDGCVHLSGSELVIPNFIEAQEAKSSDAQRKRDQRERDRDKLVSDGQALNPTGLGITATLSRAVTDGHTRSQAVTHEVTRGHTESQPVTPSRAVPSLAVPSRAEPTTAPPEAAEPGWQPLVATLFEKFETHRGSIPSPRGKDWKALQRLRGRVKSNDPEIILRWTRGIQAAFKERVDTFFDLDEKWDVLAGQGVGPVQRDWAKGRVGAEEIDKSKLSGGVRNDF